MFFLICDRDGLIRQIPKGASWVEVGVYRGDFSAKILDICAPSELHLIDSWKFAVGEHNPFKDTAENFTGFIGKIHWEHFGDDPNATQEQNYEYVKARFAGAPQVRILREDSLQGLATLPDGHFDVIYVDANHQYEYVLRDLMEARKKLRPGGMLLLNDFYEGPGGAEQNLGVIGAVNTFVKRHDFHYVAMTHGAYADVALAPDPGSPFVRAFLHNLAESDLTFIGVSDAIVPNIRYTLFRRADGSLRYVALL